MTVLHPEAASAAHHHAGDGSEGADSCGHSCDHSAQPTRSTIQDNLSEETPYKLHRRFDRLGRLFGDQAVATLMNARVAVIGLGGVGGFVAESLARSAIGHLLLVDFDDVCVTNANRQLQAMQGTIGKPKAWILRDRLQLINPQAKIEAKRAFYNANRSDEMLTPSWPRTDGKPNQFDFVVDAIDNMTAKAHLIATCKERGIPLVSSMGAAGKIDPTRVRITDLGETHGCAMARALRRILREKYGFPQKGPMGVQAVFSDEPRLWPRELTYDKGEGFRCVCPTKSDEHGCDTRSLIDGTAVYVTGVFGLTCASNVVNTLTAHLREQAPAARSKQEMDAIRSQKTSTDTDDDDEA